MKQYQFWPLKRVQVIALTLKTCCWWEEVLEVLPNQQWLQYPKGFSIFIQQNKLKFVFKKKKKHTETPQEYVQV